MQETVRQSFLQPEPEFSPIPFWFWNDLLTEEELLAQMEAFQDKGVDSFVIHPRMGLSKKIGYLSEEYFHYVIFVVEEAAKRNMKVVLYDEAMYPSGSCHGEVVKENPAFASKGLYAAKELELAQGEEMAPASADLLNPKAVECFIRLTHECYFNHLKEYFGTTVIAMFTDEPNILGRCAKAGMIPWSDGFLQDFIRCGGSEADLGGLFLLSDGEECAQALGYYKKAVYERMSAAYYGQIGDWCKNHDIAMTGHPEKSTDIGYLQYFDIPCQDIVRRYVAPGDGSAVTGVHSTMGKCSSDSARHRRKRRNGNECFGCCGALDDPYRFTREDMKWYLDWLFVRGVNTIFPHAFYYSLRGKRKEERPPEVGIHSGFWEEYKEITDYIKRMCWLLTDSVNQTEIAVLCREDMLS